MPFWFVLMLGVLANVGFSGIDAGFTYLLKPFMNKGFIDKDLSFIQYVPAIIIIGISLRGLIGSLGGYCMTYVARKVVRNFRQKVFQHIVHLPMSEYAKAPSGHLLSKILYDVEQIAQVSADALTTFVQSLCLVIGLLIVMFVISWQLSLLFLLTVPVVAKIVHYTNKRTRRVSHSVQKSMGSVTEIASEAIDGHQVVRIFGGQSYETGKFNKATEEAFRFDMKVAKIKVINMVGVQVTIAFGIGLIILAAIHLSSVIVITAGGFLSIIAAMLQLIKPLKNLSTVNSMIQQGLAGAESVFNLLDKPLEADTGVKTLNPAEGNIEFDKVCFSYQEKSPVLESLSFSLAPGQTMALVGRSGSGKSTIINLLAHFYQPNSGQIRIDGIDSKELSIESLRRNMALVSQHVTLFNDTLYNNIAYGGVQASREEVIRAAKAAFAWDFIEALPQGLETVVGEKGLRLSGGQRQRIAIARAILKNAPILILDEATSALDSESERYIQKALATVMKGRTTIVIAHRLSTIERADFILVLDKGKIIEKGSHQRLLSQNGQYSHLYKLQYNERTPEPIYDSQGI
jgi:subfamily B ATP-binding cassette protein MsbA